MRRFLFKLCKYGILTILLVNSIAWIGDKALKKSSFFKPSFLINNFDSEDRFDYLILGSSRGLTTIDSKQIDQEAGLRGVNLSMDDTDLKSHLLMLKHFFKNGYKSNYCVLTLEYSNFNNSPNRLGDNDYRFSPYIHKDYVREHFSDYETLPLKPNYNSRYFPFLKYSYYNLQLVPAAGYSLIFPKKRHRFDNRGNYTYPNSYSAKSRNTEPNIKEVEISNSLINEAKRICEQNGSKLIIYVAPYQNLRIKLKDSSNVINHSGLIDDRQFFYDQLHVNTKGRTLATQAFVKAFELKTNQN